MYVAIDGNDQWSGKLAAPNPQGTDGPVATIRQAQQLVRAIKTAEPDRATPIVVAVRGGTYASESNRWCSSRRIPEPNGPGRLPGLRRRTAGDQRRRVDYRLAGRRAGTLVCRLAGGARRASGISRSCSSTTSAGSGRGCPNRATTRSPRSTIHRRRRKDKGSIVSDLRRATVDPQWANLDDVEIMPFHQWSASRMHIASVDTQQNIVTFKGHTTGTSFWASFPEGHRFLVINVREALGEPGQWYLDRPTGRLTYVPQPGESPGQADVVAPRIRAPAADGGRRGTASQWVEHVQFRGLTFAHTNWNSAAQAASRFRRPRSTWGRRSPRWRPGTWCWKTVSSVTPGSTRSASDPAAATIAWRTASWSTGRRRRSRSATPCPPAPDDQDVAQQAGSAVCSSPTMKN